MKIFYIVSIAIFLSCEEIPNDVIEKENADYFVESISSPDEFAYSATNTKLQNFVSINKSQSVKSVWFILFNEDGSEEITDRILMNTNSSSIKKTYSGEIIFSESMLPGNYEIDFYVEDNVNPAGENIKKIGVKKFKYLSSAENLPPVISDLNIPSSVDRNTTFVFTLKVNEPNGLSDIQQVYFELLRPDSSVVFVDANNTITKFPMFDNGDVSGSGDEVRGDGIYSLKNSFGQSSQTGFWHFKFNAVDKSGLVSNTINFSLKVN
ncbi:MAG: hypothetical protein IPM32_10640 [Ignavibacteriae bacterium]|nr:hypothetical protein [Ignavibacteriota bacterium]